jgi:hypothetical protein
MIVQQAELKAPALDSRKGGDASAAPGAKFIQGIKAVQNHLSFYGQKVKNPI